jgi:hypothetical protein
MKCNAKKRELSHLRLRRFVARFEGKEGLEIGSPIKEPNARYYVGFLT